jgi:multidrug resistance efflux pump
MTDDDLRRRVDDVTRRTDSVREAKASVNGQLAAKKKQLEELLDEIRKEGLDPRTLIAERDKAKGELVSLLDTYEKDLTGAEAALAFFQES